MIHQIIQSNETLTPNHREIEILRRHFPQCFTNEGAFDIDLFKAEIEEKIDITHEGYDLNFLGKNYAKLLSSMDTTTVIVPDEEHNALPENAESQNIYISGDNLDGLKHLLKSYAGAIKCIYIDPPYNTGTDGFVYNDRFTFTAEELSIKLSISETQAEKILDLTRRGSASHSAWLTFMACRLQLARDLLTDDGVIFISIDDNEQANLKLLCDSIFGEENFVANLIWQKKTGSSDANNIATITEYILVYSKNINSLEFSQNEDAHDKDRYKLKDEFYEERGPFYFDNLDRGTLGYHESLDFPITAPNGNLVYPNGRDKKYNDGWRWKWSKDKVDWGIENGFIDVQETPSKDSGWGVYYKIYLNVDNEGNKIKRSSPFKNIIQGILNTHASNEAKKLFGTTSLFSNPKPINLISKILNISNLNSNDIVLDFFSGSATTAQAVMQLNAEDGGERRYIMVQLPEETPPKSEARKAGYDMIDQIGMERIRRAATKIKSETDAVIDYGFKHYTLAEPDDNTLDKMEVFDPKAIFADETLLDAFGKPTVLETWLVRDGYGFGANVQALKLNNYTVYHIGKHLYFIDTDFDENDMVALIDHYSEQASFCPDHWVLFGYSFTFTQTEMLRKNIVILRDGDKNLNVNIDVRY
ncbi:MAG TPA: DNA methyltransferase [Paludibacteraceae bacterium]|nr:DNA methyltransferase [Paludibacteraceae bacterium]